MTHPEIVERPAQAYVGIAAELTLEDVAKTIDRNFGALFGWLGQSRLEPSGAPFLRYRRIDMAATLDVEYGVPIARGVAASGGVRSDSLPAGRYAVLVHEGRYDGLREANAALLTWIKQRGLTPDSTPTPAGECFACRLETYVSDPRRKPDPAKWRTEVAIKLA